MIYTIPKGEHYSRPRRFGMHFGRTRQTWLVKFDKSCLYESDFDYYQWNKGMGWTYGLLSDNNSIRWCWRPSVENQAKIEVGIYQHDRSEIKEPRMSKRILLPNLDEEFKFILEHDAINRVVMLSVFGEQVAQTIEEYTLLEPKCGWLNYPYFGGKRKAPHDIQIEVKNLNQ